MSALWERQCCVHFTEKAAKFRNTELPQIHVEHMAELGLALSVLLRDLSSCAV